MISWVLSQFGRKIVYACEWGEYETRYNGLDYMMTRPIHEDMSVAPPWAKRKIVKGGYKVQNVGQTRREEDSAKNTALVTDACHFMGTTRYLNLRPSPKGARESMSNEPKLTREEAMQEYGYVSGLKAGYNLGIKEDRAGLNAAIESRTGYLGVIVATRGQEAKLAALLAACEKIEQGNYHEQPPALGDIEVLVNAFYDFRAERSES